MIRHIDVMQACSLAVRGTVDRKMDIHQSVDETEGETDALARICLFYGVAVLGNKLVQCCRIIPNVHSVIFLICVCPICILCMHIF